MNGMTESFKSAIFERFSTINKKGVIMQASNYYTDLYTALTNCAIACRRHDIVALVKTGQHHTMVAFNKFNKENIDSLIDLNTTVIITFRKLSKCTLDELYRDFLKKEMKEALGRANMLED
jgi:hypothetical protein